MHDIATGKPRILVIGMGNVLMQDEGIGVRAVEELDSRYTMPDHVTLVDGGTTGMELFEPMRNCDCLVVADAVNANLPSGSLLRIANDEINAFFQTKLSNHQLGLSDLLALLTLKGEAPGHIAIIGMVPDSLENRLGLSAAAEAGLQGMVASLVDELRGLGVDAVPRDAVAAGHWKRQARLERTSCA
ncbi:MAG: HyaD/HybD family hydrogenase maturation endopeptidase [Gammaproteobacteria bacterium]|nr:HyaD/HybD family hydrogenase maturation endopeptidase [Gammaproteobacteria bacterium]